MERLKDIHDVSAFYFFVLGGLYVIAALSFRNDFLTEQMLILIRILDIPFAMICLAYGGSTLALQLYNQEHQQFSPWVNAIFGVCLLLFLSVLFINFALPGNL